MTVRLLPAAAILALVLHGPSSFAAERLDDHDAAAATDVACAAIAADLGKPVALDVSQASGSGDWGFVVATMREPDGGRLDYAGTGLEKAADEGMVSDEAIALLRRDGSGWAVVDLAIGPMDVVWETWPADHGAPEDLFD